MKSEFMELSANRVVKQRPKLTDLQKSYVVSRFYEPTGSRHGICGYHLTELSNVTHPTFKQFELHFKILHGVRPPVFDPEKVIVPYRRHNMPSPQILRDMKVFLESLAMPDPKNDSIMRLPTHIDTWEKVYKMFSQENGDVISNQTFHKYRNRDYGYIRV